MVNEDIPGEQENPWWRGPAGIALLVTGLVLLIVGLITLRVWKVKKFGVMGFFV
jgi:hypothetical protein